MKYEGKRGTTWSIRYLDAHGQRVHERLGRADEGWNRRRAQAELRARLTAVEKEGFVKPKPTTFKAFVEGWVDRHADQAGLKRSTRASYRTIVDVHLIPAFGDMKVAEIDFRTIEQHLAAQQKKGVAATTLHRQLAVLSLIFREALREDPPLIKTNPVSLVKRPRAVKRKWRVLTPVEVTAVAAAFDELIDTAKDETERAWRQQCRTVFRVAMETGMRRAELQGLKWRCVRLADPSGPRLEVSQTWTRNAIDSPKSESGSRTITLHAAIASELFDHRARTPYSGDDEFCFTSSLGTPIDAMTYAKLFRQALAKAGITDYVRPFHDLRHSSITNGAASGMMSAALKLRSGHSSAAVTEKYIHLAGVAFPAEDAKLGARLWGSQKAGGEVGRGLAAIAAHPDGADLEAGAAGIICDVLHALTASIDGFDAALFLERASEGYEAAESSSAGPVASFGLNLSDQAAG